MTQPRTLLVLFAAATLTTAFLACDDDTTTDDGSGAGGGSAACDMGNADTACAEKCEGYYCCAEPLCQFDTTMVSKEDFVNGCIATCNDPAQSGTLKAVVQGTDCAAVVAAIKSVKNSFACACEGMPITGCMCPAGAGGSGGGPDCS